MGVHDVRRGHDQLLRELNEERAAALRRISGRLDDLIAELRDSRSRLAALAGVERSREVTRYADRRQMAQRYRWYLEVQRESLGLYRHQHLDEFYPIPGPVDA